MNRWLGADGNPLRRPTDRLESAVRALLVLVFLIGGPLVAGLGGHLTDASGLRQVRQEQSWRQVSAVLLRSAPHPYYAYGSMTTYWIPGQWRTPSGRIEVADVPTAPGARAGSIVRLWVDRAGHATGRLPLTRGLVTLRTAAAFTITLIVFGIALLMVSGVVRYLLDRRRLAIWGTEWAAFGPRWTSRR
ncbi:MAG: Rv1733c family protein [Streptosporangiaceae bacterium]